MTERTLIILKPEALERHIIGAILTYLDHAGFKMIKCRVGTEPPDKWRMHYQEVLERISESDGEALVNRMARGPCLFAIYEGDNCVAKTRELLGSTNPATAAPGTIRACYGTSTQYNVMHASDSVQSAGREITIWFP